MTDIVPSTVVPWSNEWLNDSWCPLADIPVAPDECLLVTLRGRRVLEWVVVESGDARLIRIS